jgi:hypothetical protein
MNGYDHSTSTDITDYNTNYPLLGTTLAEHGQEFYRSHRPAIAFIIGECSVHKHGHMWLLNCVECLRETAMKVSILIVPGILIRSAAENIRLVP